MASNKDQSQFSTTATDVKYANRHASLSTAKNATLINKY